ncbi:hypothetical protein B0H34DRAFT_93743 [Crassisporium funariophilum]|nr:hypothetical protein B0H34DRAFT_93743 [Crassisporium funariophilum]
MMNDDSPTPPHTTVGFLFVGLAVASIFYGITCLQTVHYFRRFRNDYQVVKLAVAVVWMLDTLNTYLSTNTVLKYVIAYRTTGTNIKPLTWSSPLLATFNSLLMCIIYGLFSWRIWILSEKNWILITFICFTGFAQLVAGCSVTILFLGDFHSTMHDRRTVDIISFAFKATTDVVISGLLCYYLQIRKTGNIALGGIMNRVLILTINNGILSCAVAIMGLITAVSAPQTSFPLAMCFVLGKAYFNTILSSLNARKPLGEKLKSDIERIGGAAFQKQLSDMGMGRRGSESTQAANMIRAPPVGNT